MFFALLMQTSNFPLWNSSKVKELNNNEEEKDKLLLLISCYNIWKKRIVHNKNRNFRLHILLEYKKPLSFSMVRGPRVNSVEINASYYRFPMESWVNTWLSVAPFNFTFSIKVSRYITDYTRLKGESAVQLWNKFSKTLDRISDKIDFWLFKMPALI